MEQKMFANKICSTTNKKCSNGNKKCLRTKFVINLEQSKLQKERKELKEQKMIAMKIAPNWTEIHDFKMAL